MGDHRSTSLEDGMGDRTRKPSTKQAGIIYIFNFEKERDIQEISRLLRGDTSFFVSELRLGLEHRQAPLLRHENLLYAGQPE